MTLDRLRNELKNVERRLRFLEHAGNDPILIDLTREEADKCRKRLHELELHTLAELEKGNEAYLASIDAQRKENP